MPVRRPSIFDAIDFARLPPQLDPPSPSAGRQTHDHEALAPLLARALLWDLLVPCQHPQMTGKPRCRRTSPLLISSTDFPNHSPDNKLTFLRDRIHFLTQIVYE